MVDGFEGLAAAIMLAMACMLIVPMGLLGAAGWFLARRKKGPAGVFLVLGLALGALLGGTAIGFTFFEREMTGTTLALESPGLRGDWVVIIEDPTVSTEFTWSGSVRPHAELRVPASGVVRVRSLDGIAGLSPEVTLGSRSATAMIGRPAPTGLGGTVLVAYGFIDTSLPRGEDTLDMMDEAEFVAWVQEREGTP